MRRKRILAVLLGLLLLAPSAYFAWRYRAMPQFGELHDDSLYFVAAKSLASGSGYRNLSLPGQPYQTKYPPLFPLWLSLIWRLNPSFPQNLGLATFFCWIMMPLLLAGSWLLYRRWGFSAVYAWGLTALLSVNLYTILFSTRLLSEIPFTVLLLVCLLLLERASGPGSRWQWALGVGMLGAAMFLTRSAGIAMLASGVGGLLMDKKRSRALAVAVPMATAAGAWTIWAQLHQSPASDLLSVYHSSYFRYQILNVGWRDYPLFIWKNLDQLLYGAGALVLPKVTAALPVKIVTQVLGVAMIAGVVRMRHNPGVRRYAMFAAAYVPLLLVWHFPPNERFVLPVFPLLLAGLATEAGRLTRMVQKALRHPNFGQRAAAYGMAAALIAATAACVACQAGSIFVYYPEVMRDHQRRAAETRAACEWIATRVPSSVRLLAYNDPTVYLYTNRRACSLALPPAYWYHDDHQSIRHAFSTVDEFAREHRLDYALITASDGHRDMEDGDRVAVLRILDRHPALERLERFGGAAIYRIRR